MKREADGAGRDVLPAQLAAARRALSARIRSEAAQRKRLDEVEQELVRLHASPGYRLAIALHEARRSLRGFLRLPLHLAAIAQALIRARRENAQSPPAAVPTPSQPPTPSPSQPAADEASVPRIATIVDEFTALSLAPEATLCQLRPECWRQQIEAFGPDLLFVESAWRGTGGSWRNMLAPLSAELVELLAWCTEHGVPSVFWNKEDPIHFDYFADTAAHFDHIRTTDADCLPRYVERMGRKAGLLQFAAQPALHHPLETEERVDAFCFAGSYYRKYEARQRDFARIVGRLRPYKPVVILDRNQGRNDPEFEFPAEFRPLIVGSADPAEMEAVYKRYRFAINVNTVTASGTMFARRVFDLLASNTPVVSNESRAYEGTFGAGIVSVIGETGVPPELGRILADDEAYRRHRLAGLRAVMARHTWRVRIEALMRDLGLAARARDKTEIYVAAKVSGAEGLAALRNALARQTRPPDGVFLIGEEPAPALGLGAVRVFADAASLADALPQKRGSWVACLHPAHYYGRNYLLDLALATQYCTGDAIGKAAHFVLEEGGIALRGDGLRYRARTGLSPWRAVLRTNVHRPDIVRALDGSAGEVPGSSIDEFNYCENAAAADAADRVEA